MEMKAKRNSLKNPKEYSNEMKSMKIILRRRSEDKPSVDKWKWRQEFLRNLQPTRGLSKNIQVLLGTPW